MLLNRFASALGNAEAFRASSSNMLDLPRSIARMGADALLERSNNFQVGSLDEN